MSKDSFYTPKILADKLINYASRLEAQEVADFCVGDGELLRAAENQWPGIGCYGTDISNEAILSTVSKHGQWKLSTLDFLDREAKTKDKIFKKNKKFQLILLNPPFSCFGAEVNEIYLDGEKFLASTAMTFLSEALTHLKDDGWLYAILPASVAYAQKDRKLWDKLEERYNLCILEESSARYFKGCSPRIILVSLNDFHQTSKYRNTPRISLDLKGVSVFRGKISMNLIPKTKGEYFMVHSTNIQNHSLFGLTLKPKNHLAEVSGPAILIPRVGNPKSSKMCIIDSNETYVLSDCILAIKMANIQDARILYHYLQDNWQMVSELYTGTGARYITVEKLNQFLNLDILDFKYPSSIAI